MMKNFRKTMTSYRNVMASLVLTLVIGGTAIAQERSVGDWMKSANFILGVYSVEDIVQIPSTKWIVGSGLTTQGPGMDYKYTKKNYLHLFDAETETVSVIERDQIKIDPDAKRFPETKTPPDWEVFSPHGIGIGAQNGNTVTFYATNHGNREAIEVFEINISKAIPRFTWIGTVLAPEDGFVDAVAWIPGTDGFVVTAVTNPLDKEAGEKQMSGRPIGWVRTWNAKDGWKTVAGTELESSPNGIVVSDDGKHVFVAATTNFKVYRVSLGSGKPVVASVKVDGFPDNIRWSADRKSLLVGVHTEDPEKFVAAQITAVKVSGLMYTSFNITRIDPETMETEIVMPSGVYGAFGAATGAIEVGDRLWVSSTGSDRVAIFDLKAK